MTLCRDDAILVVDGKVNVKVKIGIDFESNRDERRLHEINNSKVARDVTQVPARMPKIKGRHGMLHDAQSTSNTASGLSVYVFIIVIVLEDSVLDAVGSVYAFVHYLC